MFTISNAEFLQGLLASLFAYVIVVTTAGFLQALIAYKLGDDSVAERGFLSFNPVVYVEWFGFLCCVLTGIGWGALIPIDPSRFRGKNIRAQAVVAFMIQPVAHFLITLFAVALLAIFLGGYTIALPMLGFFVQRPALAFACKLLLVAVCRASMFLFVYSFILATLRSVLLYKLSWLHTMWPFVETMVMLTAFIIYALFAGPLFMGVITLLSIFESWVWVAWAALGRIIGFISWYK
jgi:hypothetical protein